MNIQCINSGVTTITINGETKKYEGPISIINGKVYKNGKPIEDFENVDSKDKPPIIINVTGDVEKIEGVEEVHVAGDVKGNIEARNSIKIGNDCHGAILCNGNVTVGGNCEYIDTSGNVTVKGNCSGNIDTIGIVHVGSNNKNL